MRPGRAADHSPPSSAAVKEEYSYISAHPLGHTEPITGSLYYSTQSSLAAQFLRSTQKKKYCTVIQTSLPAIPSKPISPRGPGNPLGPGGPSRPGVPFCPLVPGIPGTPFNPGSPLSPGIPGMPGTKILKVNTSNTSSHKPKHTMTTKTYAYTQWMQVRGEGTIVLGCTKKTGGRGGVCVYIYKHTHTEPLIHSTTWHYMEVSTQLHFPATLLPETDTPQYTTHRRLSESHRLSGCLEKKNIPCPCQK